MNEQMITKWFNFYGLIFMILILLPNIVFAVTHKDGFENLYRNKFVEVAEQIGRFGCFICMFVSIPLPIGGFWFDCARLVYIICGSLISAAYVIGWIVFRKTNSVFKSLYLSIVPSLLFVECGVFTLNIPLIMFCAVFAPCHILISYKNAKTLNKE